MFPVRHRQLHPPKTMTLTDDEITDISKRGVQDEALPALVHITPAQFRSRRTLPTCRQAPARFLGRRTLPTCKQAPACILGRRTLPTCGKASARFLGRWTFSAVFAMPRRELATMPLAS